MSFETSQWNCQTGPEDSQTATATMSFPLICWCLVCLLLHRAFLVRWHNIALALVAPLSPGLMVLLRSMSKLQRCDLTSVDRRREVSPDCKAGRPVTAAAGTTTETRIRATVVNLVNKGAVGS